MHHSAQHARTGTARPGDADAGTTDGAGTAGNAGPTSVPSHNHSPGPGPVPGRAPALGPVLRPALGVARLAVAALAATALALTAHTAAQTRGGLANFFSYFTVESNILGVLVFAAGGAVLLAGRGGVPELLRGAAALYLVITGIVYGLILSAQDPGQLTPWINDVLHRAAPLLFAVDWLLDPPRRAIPVRRAARWLVFPLLYLPYTLIRGRAADWYPYPFLDPRAHGYLRVAVGAVAVTVAFLAVGGALRLSGARMRARAEKRASRPPASRSAPIGR